MPSLKLFTAGQLRRGLESLSRPAPAAIMFGLESGLDIDSVVTLTWSGAKKYKSCVTYVGRVLDLQPIHIRSKYVFWRLESDGSPSLLFGINQEIFDAFGMVWGELDLAYKTMLMIDEDAEAADLLNRVSRHDS
jgi:hypothetical protein